MTYSLFFVLSSKNKETIVYFRGLLLNSRTTKPTKKKQPYLYKCFREHIVGLQIIKNYIQKYEKISIWLNSHGFI